MAVNIVGKPAIISPVGAAETNCAKVYQIWQNLTKNKINGGRVGQIEVGFYLLHIM